MNNQKIDILAFIPKEHMTWEHFINKNNKDDDLPKPLRLAAKDALNYLRETLRDNFIEEAFRTGHPFIISFGNTAPVAREWLVHFVNALRELKECPRFASVLSEIKNSQKYHGGISVLESAYKFKKACFDIEFEPEIAINGQIKKPDFKIIDTASGFEIVVEVTAIGDSKPEKKARNTSQNILFSMLGSMHAILWCGIIYKTLASAHQEEIVEKIKAAVEDIKLHGGMRIVEEAGAIEVALSSEEAREGLAGWAAKRKLEIGNLGGPPIDTNEIIRVGGRIEEKQLQLPPDKLGIVIIYDTNLFIRTSDWPAAINYMEEKLYEYNQIWAAIIIGSWIGKEDDNCIEIGNHELITRMRDDLYCEKFLILRNRFCKFDIPAEVENRILGIYRNHL